MQDDGPRWDARYAALAPPEPRAPDAADRWPGLLTLLPTSGRCVDIASGHGAVTLWLALRGVHVTALDVSAVAIDRLAASAATHGVVDRIDARTIDLDQGLPADLIDLDLIVCQRFRDRALYGPMVDRLRLGGLAVITVLSSVGTERPSRFHAAAGELSEAFGERGEILHQYEGDGLAHVVVRRR
jgi:SAM-dependent methyltransferase